MNNQAALKTENSVKERGLYLAIELSRKKWKLGFSDGKGGRARIRTIEAGDLEQIRGEIEQAKKHFGLEVTSPTVSCYEAGREGFWVHRALTEKGIDNIIVDAASIDVKRRKRAKTDRIDAESLVRKLVRYDGGEGAVWSVVRVPSVEAEDARQTHREIGVLQRERQQHRMRIQSLLFTQGVDVTVTPKLMRDLERIPCWNGQPLGAELRERIRREYARLRAVEEDLLALRKQQKLRLKKEPTTPAMEKIRLMQQLCGIAMKSSWVFVMELFGWRHFQNRREVAGALGLTPMPYQSGDSSHDQGISRAGNRKVRAMAIEIAWSWLRYQPESRLSQWYQRRFGSGGGRMRRIGIVAMARRLMVDLWRFVEFGIVPEGARMKASGSSVSE
jgi:transposase